MNTDDLYRLLRTGHVRAQGIVDTIADPLLVLDEGLRVQAASRAFYETFRVDSDQTIGKLVYELGDGQWDIPELRRLLVGVIPKATAIINYEVEHDFPGLGRKTMLLTARTLHNPDSGAHSMLLLIEDATERLRQDAAKDILFDELRHRIKNLLALTLAIARQTPTEGRSAEEYRDALLGRFGALTEAQDLAFAMDQDNTVLALVGRILAPYSVTPEAVAIEAGAAVALGPQMMMSLSLILHELATNAAKHGALSVAGGQVRVSWVMDQSNQLRIKWVESGGPPVTAPAKTGFGTKLIQSTVIHNLSGQVEQDYAVAGLQAEIVIPFGEVAAPK